MHPTLVAPAVVDSTVVLVGRAVVTGELAGVELGAADVEDGPAVIVVAVTLAETVVDAAVVVEVPLAEVVVELAVAAVVVDAAVVVLAVVELTGTDVVLEAAVVVLAVTLTEDVVELSVAAVEVVSTVFVVEVELLTGVVVPSDGPLLQSSPESQVSQRAMVAVSFQPTQKLVVL